MMIEKLNSFIEENAMNTDATKLRYVNRARLMVEKLKSKIFLTPKEKKK